MCIILPDIQQSTLGQYLDIIFRTTCKVIVFQTHIHFINTVLLNLHFCQCMDFGFPKICNTFRLPYSWTIVHDNATEITGVRSTMRDFQYIWYMVTKHTIWYMITKHTFGVR